MVIANLLNDFRDSSVPENRLLYRKSIFWLIGFGKKLMTLTENQETKEQMENDVAILERLIKDYKLYPKLNGLNGDNLTPAKQGSLIPTQIL